MYLRGARVKGTNKSVILCVDLFDKDTFSLVYDVSRGKFLKYFKKDVWFGLHSRTYALEHKGKYYFVRGIKNHFLQIVKIDFSKGIEKLGYYQVGDVVYIPLKRKLPRKLKQVLKHFLKEG